MLEQYVIYKPRNGYPFHVTAKRYRSNLLPVLDADDADSVTLILLHGTSFHKETWEPTLQRIFDLAACDGSVRIREAWAIECPNHGASAELNEEAFQQNEFRHNCMLAPNIYYLWPADHSIYCDSYLLQICNCRPSLSFRRTWRRRRSGFQIKKFNWSRSFIRWRSHVSHHVEKYFR
jgi:hypothetical protein